MTSAKRVASLYFCPPRSRLLQTRFSCTFIVNLIRHPNLRFERSVCPLLSHVAYGERPPVFARYARGDLLRLFSRSLATRCPSRPDGRHAPGDSVPTPRPPGPHLYALLVMLFSFHVFYTTLYMYSTCLLPLSSDYSARAPGRASRTASHRPQFPHFCHSQDALASLFVACVTHFK